MTYPLTKTEGRKLEEALAKSDKPMLNRIRVGIMLNNVTQENKKEKLDYIYENILPES